MIGEFAVTLGSVHGSDHCGKAKAASIEVAAAAPLVINDNKATAPAYRVNLVIAASPLPPSENANLSALACTPFYGIDEWALAVIKIWRDYA
jgi:hypothetical protein